MDFNENYEQQLTPEAREASEFDYDAIFERLDGETSKENMEGAAPAFTSKDVFEWVFSAVHERGDPHAKLRMIGRRFVALCWVSNPQYFGNDPSMNEVARSIGCHKAVLSELTAEVTRRFGRRNPHQDHAANFNEGKPKSI